MSRALAALLLVGATLTACGGDDPTTLRVYAASSLAAPFRELAGQFERAHEGVEVELNLAGSSDLVAQIVEGAPADVLASADEPNMAKLVEAGLAADEPVPFASNTLQIAVPPGNPAGVTGMDDLADAQLVTCAPEVPCGAAAQRLAEAAGVTLRPVSEEQSVADVLAKVASGEADAGLVYVTDVRAAGGDVEGIEVDQSAAAVNVYPIAPVEGSEHAELAAEFVELVLGPQGQRVLREAGFAAPGAT